MILAHKIVRDSNDAQAMYCREAVSIARRAYNWAWDAGQKQYDVWKADPLLSKPSDAALRRQLSAIKRDQFPWMLDADGHYPCGHRV